MTRKIVPDQNRYFPGFEIWLTVGWIGGSSGLAITLALKTSAIDLLYLNWLRLCNHGPDPVANVFCFNQHFGHFLGCVHMLSTPSSR